MLPAKLAGRMVLADTDGTVASNAPFPVTALMPVAELSASGHRLGMGTAKLAYVAAMGDGMCERMRLALSHG